MSIRQLTITLCRYDGELWYEFGVPEARKLLAAFTPQEWRELSNVWRHQPETWQDRLAYVLGAGDLRYEVPQLMRMIVKGEKEVALTARDNLRNVGAEAVKAQFDEQCIEEFGLPANLLEPDATVNAVIDYLETKSQYEIRCGEWKLKPEQPA